MFTFTFNETIKKVALTESENVYDPVHSLRFRCSKYRDHQTRRLGFRRMSTEQPTIVNCVVFYPKFRGLVDFKPLDQIGLAMFMNCITEARGMRSIRCIEFYRLEGNF